MENGGIIYKITVAAMVLGILACIFTLFRLLAHAPQAAVYTNAQLVQEVVSHAAC